MMSDILIDSLKFLELPSFYALDIIDRLNEPHRFYHNENHVNYMLGHYKKIVSNQTKEVIAAIILHDIIYDPTALDSEERSVEYARSILHGMDVDLVSDIIISTKKHKPISDTGDTYKRHRLSAIELVLDLDMLILAEEPKKYLEYAYNIRREFGHINFDQYRIGRTTVLQKIMADDIFFYFEDSEPYAQQNIAWEIEILERNDLQFFQINT